MRMLEENTCISPFYRLHLKVDLLAFLNCFPFKSTKRPFNLPYNPLIKKIDIPLKKTVFLRKNSICLREI